MKEATRGTWTLNAIAYAIKNNLEVGLKTTANFPFSIDQLEAEILTTRSNLLEQLEVNRAEGLNEFYQEINCIPLDCKDFGLCCERSTKQPSLHFEAPVFMAHNYTGLATQTSPFNVYLSGNNSHIYQKYRSRYTAERPYVVYRLHQGVMHGFVFNPPTPNLKVISLRAIFENPYDINKYECCNFNSRVDRFPAPNFIIQQIIDTITNKWASWYYRFQGQAANTQTPQI